MKATKRFFLVGLALSVGASCETNPYGGYNPQSGDCPPGLICPDGGVPPAGSDGGGGGGGNEDGGGGGGGGDGGGGGNDDGGGGNTSTDMRTMPTEKTVFIGAGTGVTPFDIKTDGTSRVKLDENQNVVIDRDGLTLRPKPFIWIANSGDGTESKIDTRTFKQLARYCTYPGCNGDPSRSTVGLSGDVVVTNRANYFSFANASRASAVKIAADKKDCVDRNGNGMIDTFEGEGAIPAQFMWPAGAANSPDECVVWLTHLTKDRNGNVVGGAGTLPRAAAFDAIVGDDGVLKEYVYIGLYNTAEAVRIDAKDGKILKQFNVGVNTYGAVMDRTGNLWFRGGNLVKVEVRNGDKLTSYGESPSGCSYGISADSRGYIYTAGSNCVSRFNPADGKWESLVPPNSPCFMRGLGLDSKFNLWVADTCNGIYHIDASKPHGMGLTFKRMVSPRGVGETNYYLGVGIDVDEHPWIVSEGRGGAGLNQPPGGSSIVYHVDPVTYNTNAVGTGRNSYTYSDMTGAQLRIAGSPVGSYTHTINATCNSNTVKPKWVSATWTIDAPAGTSVKARYRLADDTTTLKTTMYTDITGMPPLDLNNYNNILQISFELKSDSVEFTPTLKNIQAKYICE